MDNFFLNLNELYKIYNSNRGGVGNKVNFDEMSYQEMTSGIISSCGLTPGSQNDSHELFQKIIEKYKSSTHSHKVDDIFNIIEKNLSICANTEQEIDKDFVLTTDTQTPYMTIVATEYKTVENALNGKWEKIEGSNSCESVESYFKKTTYEPVSNYIFINIKLHKQVINLSNMNQPYPKYSDEEITLNTEDKITINSVSYKKFAIIQHISGSGETKQGHYIAYIYHSDGNIYKINEGDIQIVEKIYMSEMKKNTISNVIYKKESLIHEYGLPVGINNVIANTCFYNAILQVLFNIPEFTELIKKAAGDATTSAEGDATTSIAAPSTAATPAAVPPAAAPPAAAPPAAAPPAETASGVPILTTTDPTISVANKSYYIDNEKIPVHFMGLYVKSKPDETSVQGYAKNNSNALVLFSANETNKGKWRKERRDGTLQAQGTTKLKNTFGLHTGNTDSTEITSKFVWTLIKNSLEELEKFYLESNSKYEYIAIPDTLNSPLKIYSGTWKQRVGGDVIDKVNALFTTRLLYGKDRSDELEQIFFPEQEGDIILYVIEKEKNTYNIGDEVEGKSFYIMDDDIIGTNKKILYLTKIPTDENKKKQVIGNLSIIKSELNNLNKLKQDVKSGAYSDTSELDKKQQKFNMLRQSLASSAAEGGSSTSGETLLSQLVSSLTSSAPVPSSPVSSLSSLASSSETSSAEERQEGETSTTTFSTEERQEGETSSASSTTSSTKERQTEENIFSSQEEKRKKNMKLAAEGGATDWKRVSADVSSFKDGSPTVTEPEYYYSNTLDIKIHFDPREATIDEAQKYIDNVDKELREFPRDGDQKDKEKLEKKLKNAKHVLESVRLYKKKERDPYIINQKKVDKMSHMLFVSYLEEDDQTDYKGNIENIKNKDMYKKMLYNKIKTIGIYLEPVKNITRYLDNREEQLKTDYAIKLASKEGTQYDMEKSKALKENTSCVIQSLGRMETIKDFFKKSSINRLELEGHLLEKINKEMDNEKTLDIYNTSYELEYFRKLFPTFKYDTSLETTPKYDLNIMLTKDFVEDPCDLFKVKKTEYSTEFSNKKEGIQSLPKIVSIIYNYKHTYLNAEKINNDNTGDAIEPLYNLKTDCIDVTNAKTEGLLGDVYKYAFNNVMLNDNIKHINQAKYVFEKIKKEALIGKEKPLKIMAEYVGPNPHIAEKYGKDSAYCKKKLSDMGRGKEEDLVKSKICRASAIAGLKLPLLNKKIKKRLDDILEEIEIKLKIENKTKKEKMPSTVDKDKDTLAMLENMLQTS